MGPPKEGSWGPRSWCVYQSLSTLYVSGDFGDPYGRSGTQGHRYVNLTTHGRCVDRERSVTLMFRCSLGSVPDFLEGQICLPVCSFTVYTANKVSTRSSRRPRVSSSPSQCEVVQRSSLIQDLRSSFVYPSSPFSHNNLSPFVFARPFQWHPSAVPTFHFELT